MLQKKLQKKLELVTAPYEVCLNETTIEGILQSSLRTSNCSMSVSSVMFPQFFCKNLMMCAKILNHRQTEINIPCKRVLEPAGATLTRNDAADDIKDPYTTAYNVSTKMTNQAFATQ